ncbi:hypothetical protein N7508_004400 [Penicillium antarcticum]|uniref:uncharacterized protein n=1 Tax=Penicillium antarcticum TaxID=416450 RepID=UPI00239FCF02|nr:uncharacterized protein N7508_004400 [Penicillium antarcticum]KAJ5309021.1 hypothetical protein N7508_004400 [Penicillium antarcticum]
MDIRALQCKPAIRETCRTIRSKAGLAWGWSCLEILPGLARLTKTSSNKTDGAVRVAIAPLRRKL